MAESLFTRFLTALEVPHTAGYSDEQFRGMTFKSLFGLSHLLKDYGIPNESYRLDDKNELKELQPPYLAQKRCGTFVIVERYDEAADIVEFDIKGKHETTSADDFKKSFNGIVLAAFPDDASSEPHYHNHAFTDFISKISKYILVSVLLALLCYFVITRGIYTRPSLIFVMGNYIQSYTD